MAEEKIMVDRRSSPWKKYAMYGLIAFAVIAAAILLIFLFYRIVQELDLKLMLI